MKSISLKLILAFASISLITAVVVVLMTRENTRDQFSEYLLATDTEKISSLLTAYYRENGSWENLAASASEMMAEAGIALDERGNLPFTLTDPEFIVILAGGMYKPGDVLLSIDQPRSTGLMIDGKVAGYLDIRYPMPAPEGARDIFIERMSKSLLLTGAAAILIALSLALVVSRIITRPILKLTAAAKKVSTGDLSQRVSIYARDEIGELGRVFNTMVSRIDDLLRSRKQMTADIAHELRTPISVILGHAEGIHDGVIPATPASIEIIRSEAIRLEQLVNDLRVLALADAGELDLNNLPVDAGMIVDQVYDLFQLQAQGKGIQLSHSIEAGLPQIEVDANRIVQVLSNLVENALRHTPPQGEVKICVGTTSHEFVEFTVSDTGEGIPPEDLEKVFDRLYRTDRSRQRDKGGSGLGLALAKNIVELHGGRIHAENNPTGGTRMVIQLPAVV